MHMRVSWSRCNLGNTWRNRRCVYILNDPVHHSWHYAAALYPQGDISDDVLVYICLKTKHRCFVFLAPDVPVCISDFCVGTAKCLQEMLKSGTQPPTSKPQLLCQMVSSKTSAYLTTKENILCSSFTLLISPLCAPRRSLLSVIGPKNLRNCQVIGASMDSHFCHLACINTPKKQGGLAPMNIPLVSDPKRTIAQEYGVLKADEGISFRGLFIIDDKDILRQITVNDLPVGRSVDETLRLVQPFQFTDKHGEVCPAGWKPGHDTIKPDVQKSKGYFSKQK